MDKTNAVEKRFHQYTAENKISSVLKKKDDGVVDIRYILIRETIARCVERFRYIHSEGMASPLRLEKGDTEFVDGITDVA